MNMMKMSWKEDRCRRSLFKSNITNEIEDINKKPPQQVSNVPTANTSSSSNHANNAPQMSQCI
jgi:hypothetical protein